MVRFNDKNAITTLSGNDILPITDVSDSTDDKKITLTQIGNFVENQAGLAKNDLSNTGMVTNAILSAPNGIMEASADNQSIIVKSNIKVLIPNGRDVDKKLTSTEYILLSDVTQSISTLSDGTYLLFISDEGTIAYSNLNDIYISTEEPTISSSNAYWFNIDINKWQFTQNGGTNWTDSKVAEIGQFVVEDGLITQTISNNIFYIPNAEAVALRDLSNITENGIQVIKENGGAGTPIGTVIPLNCTADYIPDGCLPCDGAEYTKAQFGSLWTNYLTATTPLLNTCSYEDYATEITTYGQCGKFALDTVNEKFKVPTLKDGSVIQQALSDTELAKAYNAGLPNITGTAKLKQSSRATGFDGFSGAITSNGASFGGDSYSYVQESPSGFNFNASNSNPIYGNSTTVQPNAVALRYFIVVANGQINEEQMDWSAWASSLQGKANADLTNVTVMKRYPTETYVNGTSWYTVYSDGWIEQGGTCTSGNWEGQLTLLKPFSNTSYNMQATVARNSFEANLDGFNYFVTVQATSETTFDYATVGHASTQAFRAFYWYACGY